MSIEGSSTDGDASLWSSSALIKDFQVLRWHYILNYVILLNCLYYSYLICLNCMDIQLVVERRKRPQIQTLVLIGTLLKRLDLVGNFDDLRDEVINMENIIKKLPDENAQLKETIANLQHKVIIVETATNSVEQYDRRNNIEVTGIPDNIEGKNLDHSVIEVFKKLSTFHNDI